VKAELTEAGIGEEAIGHLIPLISLQGGSQEKLGSLKALIASSETGLRGISEMEQLYSLIAAAGIRTTVELDLSLARGLNYYTGAIIEVKSTETEIGSICGGGRYDDLTGIFGLPGISGVGVSFGADRIYDVLLSLGRFPESRLEATELLFVNFGEKEVEFCLPVIRAAREAGIRTELYPDAAKMKKQLGYANDHMIPYVAIVGEDELKQGMITLKLMGTGEQYKLLPDELVGKVLGK
jgi:histidyl-tRNA synthetase